MQHYWLVLVRFLGTVRMVSVKIYLIDGILARYPWRVVLKECCTWNDRWTTCSLLPSPKRAAAAATGMYETRKWICRRRSALVIAVPGKNGELIGNAWEGKENEIVITDESRYQKICSVYVAVHLSIRMGIFLVFKKHSKAHWWARTLFLQVSLFAKAGSRTLLHFHYPLLYPLRLSPRLSCRISWSRLYCPLCWIFVYVVRLCWQVLIDAYTAGNGECFAYLGSVEQGVNKTPERSDQREYDSGTN